MRLRRFGKHRETKIADQSKAMGWQDLTHSDENAKYHCYRFARLISDDTGQELGLVMQFYEWGPACVAGRLPSRAARYLRGGTGRS